MEVIDIVKAKLPESKPEDSILNIHIEEVGQSIKTYCNREDIPPELRYVYANMVVDLLNHQNRVNSEEGQSSVASIREGDVTVQFGAARVKSTEEEMKSLVFNYKDQLNRFRKLRW
ncbi:hypothetical protein ACFFF5_21055 [Lederbergia wuyishanensis]|uniref:Uncharacterized protein n=1 Tax=Lederbergia wuyishanensis TaxID=1347903 RepID=A0ABU0D7B5_9BACI|nr:hypothetical protein [Lederbergia wuyishanensis]MCJ8008906.1 hypothetical protein [Lederbergia wuyishanensis]MDQ0344231.1 hypothetical protein [Lederbergia wuyishanensis]